MMISMQKSSPSSVKWFAVYTIPRHEKKVSSQLQQRNIEVFLPFHRTVSYWKNRTKAELELPLFPSYVFVRMPMEMKGAVLSVPGAVSVVGSKREPWPLPDNEMEILRRGLDDCRPAPHPYFNTGDRVRIMQGPLAGMEGFLMDKKNGSRMVLSIEQIMRSVSVEVNVQHLQLVDTRERQAS